MQKTQDPSDPSKMIEDQQKKDWARSKFDKSESDWVLVQIIEDENQPELVGSFKVMKLPKNDSQPSYGKDEPI